MATDVGNRRFVDEITKEIILPGVDRLMESRYFADLRAGKLTKRRLGGFAVQHYVHNMGVLKAFALGAVQHAVSNGAFRVFATGLSEEVTHPDMCKKLGFALGLADDDFEKAIPVYECMLHTAAVIHGMFLATMPEMRANALANETMVQRYATEFDTYVRRHFDLPEAALEFFVEHKGADIEHTERAAKAIAAMAVGDEDQERVRAMCRNMVRLKIGKFDGIHAAYA